MPSHHQHCQLAPNRGPGISSSAANVGLPEERVYRPNSTCTKTLITQLSRISHKKTKPCSAPKPVVSNNSPVPIMLPARIMPGPI